MTRACAQHLSDYQQAHANFGDTHPQIEPVRLV